MDNNELKDEQPCISQNIAKLPVSGSLTIGGYVLVTKYLDADPNDPWRVGFITEVGQDVKGDFIRVDEDMRKWRNVQLITADEGKEIVERWSNYR